MTLNVFTKKAAKTNNTQGKQLSKRTVEELIQFGVVNIDKPPGPTSHQVSDFVQKILKIKKAGHGGSLDPKVTGVLPVALQNASRLSQLMLKGGKEYVGILHLHKEIDEKDIRKAIQKFTGKIKQLPPVRSAVKRQLRTREIYEFKIIEITEKDVLFQVSCEAGTYIRKLCLHPHTEILTESGSMTASDFYTHHPRVYSFKSGKMTIKKPSAVQRINSPSTLIRIKMSSGISFIVTADHELLSSKSDGYKMIEAQKLKAGDYLVKSLKYPEENIDLVIPDLLDNDYYIQQDEIKEKCKQVFITKYGSIRAMNRKHRLDRKAFLSKSRHAITIKHLKCAGIYQKVKRKINTFKTQKGAVIKMKKLNKDFFYLLGLIASDGNNTKEKKTRRYTRVKFHNKNEALINTFLKTHKQLFPSIPISKKRVHPGLLQLDTSNSFLATIAASLGIKSPQKKSDILPILHCKPELIRNFLKGYFDGDGSAYYKEKIRVKGHYTNIRYHTISELDADRLHKMLLKLRIPNKIFRRRVKNSWNKKAHTMYVISIESLAAKRKFIQDVGSNHRFKLSKFKKILSIKDNTDISDHYYVPFHFKREIRKRKNQLQKMGGNLHRILSGNIPMTRGFYKKASKITKIPLLDNFIIEKIKSIEKVKGTHYVYDMTVPETHNFLIETGFISSNCHDIGLDLGVGGNMAALRRIRASLFKEDTLVTLQDLQDAYTLWKKEGNEKFIRHCIHPAEKMVEHIPKVWVFDTTIKSICHGRDVYIPGISKLTEMEVDQVVAIMSLKGELIALGKAVMPHTKIMKETKGNAVKTAKVFMNPETYAN